MPVTYEPIASTTLGATAADVTFSSIPGTYTDLVIVIANTITSGSGDAINMQFNSDTGSQYSQTRLYGTGSGSPGSDRSSSQTSIFYVGYSSTSNPSANIISIMNYSNTTTNKTCIHRANNDALTLAGVGLWRSTSAITTIRLFPSSGNFASNSVFTLFGIKAA